MSELDSQFENMVRMFVDGGVRFVIIGGVAMSRKILISVI